MRMKVQEISGHVSADFTIKMKRRRWMKVRRFLNPINILIIILCIVILTACGKQDAETEEKATNGLESEWEEQLENEPDSKQREGNDTPSKEEVEAAREVVFEGMNEEDISRLKENIKVANQRLEKAYLNDNLFEKLSDPNHLCWNYIDQEGDIQVGWSYSGSSKEMLEICKSEELTLEEFYEKYGEPVMQYNRFDVDNFVALIEDMKQSIQNEILKEDMDQLIMNANKAKETHEAEYVEQIYKILHDMDYFLFRYGLEDVAKYVDDPTLIGTYYGMLSIYQQ